MKQVHPVNQVIDRTLFAPTEEHIRELLMLNTAHNTFALADRIRRRVTLLRRQEVNRLQPLIERRDLLILRLYHHTVLKRWHCAWCDGSTTRHRCGIGGLLMNPDGQIIRRFSRAVALRPPFETEIAAVAEIMQLSRECNVKRLLVYSDCVALVDLFHRQRTDPRLESIHALYSGFIGFQLRAIPRQHNQPAKKRNIR